MLGMTCGAHRLWTHRTYTATLGLRVFLMLCQTMAGQVTIFSFKFGFFEKKVLIFNREYVIIIKESRFYHLNTDP